MESSPGDDEREGNITCEISTSEKRIIHVCAERKERKERRTKGKVHDTSQRENTKNDNRADEQYTRERSDHIPT
jgi:hypothetical protein